jgi:hypothetical protein
MLKAIALRATIQRSCSGVGRDLGDEWDRRWSVELGETAIARRILSCRTDAEVDRHPRVGEVAAGERNGPGGIPTLLLTERDQPAMSYASVSFRRRSPVSGGPDVDLLGCVVQG